MGDVTPQPSRVQVAYVRPSSLYTDRLHSHAGNQSILIAPAIPRKQASQNTIGAAAPLNFNFLSSISIGPDDMRSTSTTNRDATADNGTPTTAGNCFCAMSKNER